MLNYKKEEFMHKSTTAEALNALLEFFKNRNPSWDTSQREWVRDDEIKVAGSIHRTFRHIDNDDCRVTVRDGAAGFCISSLNTSDIVMQLDDKRYPFDPTLSKVNVESSNGDSVLYLSTTDAFDYGAWGVYQDFVYTVFDQFEISEKYQNKEKIGFLIKDISHDELAGVLNRVGFPITGEDNSLSSNRWDAWVEEQAKKQHALKAAQEERIRLRQEARANVNVANGGQSKQNKPSTLPSGPTTRRWGAGVSIPTARPAVSPSSGKISKPRESTNNEDVVLGGFSSGAVTNTKEYLDLQVVLPNWPAQNSFEASNYASACLLKKTLRPLELERMLDAFKMMDDGDYNAVLGQAMLSPHLNKPVYQLLFEELMHARPVSNILAEESKIDMSDLL
jgi:hypothetical protein